LPPWSPGSCACHADALDSKIEPEVAGSVPAHAKESDLLFSVFLLARFDAVNCHWHDRELKAQGTDVIIVADMLPSV
jgi:ABC-type uncharacterized transport system permease subunit